MTIRRKIILLILLIVILFVLIFVAIFQHEYRKAREESIRQIEESGGTVIKEDNEIEFDANEPEESLEYINVLLVGIDDEENYARTDTIMIAQYRPDQGKAKLVSLMRDSYVSIPGYGNYKLNAAFSFGGVELLRQTIKENFDLDIHYFAQVNFNGFVRIVDILAPNGIEVDIERKMYYVDGPLVINFQPGIQMLNGEDALKYVRFRSDYQNDFGRVKRQQEILGKLKDELISLSGVRRIPQLLGSIEPYIQTNLSSQKMLSYGKNLFLNPVKSIESLTIPIQGGYTDKRYSHAGEVLELDMEKNKAELHKFLELTTEDLEAASDTEEIGNS